jgi:hypothetical protein
MVQMVAEGLGQLAQMAAQTSPELAKGLQGMQQQFMQLIEQAMQGGGGGGGSRPVQEQGQGAPQGPQGVM